MDKETYSKYATIVNRYDKIDREIDELNNNLYILHRGHGAYDVLRRVGISGCIVEDSIDALVGIVKNKIASLRAEQAALKIE